MSIYTNGSYLYAKCQDVDGNWHQSQLDLNRCPGALVANNNSVLVCGRGGYGISRTLPRGSWRASCKDASKSGGTLYAQCDNGAGGWHSTTLDLDDCPGRIVGNAGGNLVCTSGTISGGGVGGVGGDLPGGTWQSTCRAGYVRGSMFYAKCNTGEGPSWHDTSLNLNTCPSRLVGNAGGDLFCQRSGNGSGYTGTLPPGSWRTTCRNGRMQGSIVYAECYDGAGTWRQASFDTRRCSGSLGNNHGTLVCTGGTMYRRLQ